MQGSLRSPFLVAVCLSCLPSTVLAADLPKPGTDVIAFSYVAPDGGAGASAMHLRSIKLMAAGYQCLAEIRLTDKAAQPYLGQGWGGPGPRGSLTVMSGTEAEIRCDIPFKAGGIVLDYSCPDNIESAIVLRVNSSRTLLQPVHRPVECCVFLARGLTGLGVASRSPAYNLWALSNVEPGPNSDGEVRMQLALANGHDPLSSGEYRLHVFARKEPDSEKWPQHTATFQVHGIDITAYDGFTASAYAPYDTSGSASLGDSSNFSWGGGVISLKANQWGTWAVPFEECHNSNTAGDGVLKLFEVTRVNVHVGAVANSLTNEFIVGTPHFYVGTPPAGIHVVGKKSYNVESTPLKELAPMPPHRRRPMFQDGLDIQSIAVDADCIWLGTAGGLVKVRKDAPELRLGQWSLAEGMVDDDVQAVHVDGKDLWIGTTNGVCRFDGTHFTNYNMNDGLLPGPPMAIKSTPDTVWIGMTRGLASFDKKSGQITAYKRSGGWAPESTGGQGVPIAEGRGVYADMLAVDDQDGTLWHGAAGLCHTGSDGQAMDSFYGTTSRAIGAFPDGDKLWYVHAGGVILQEKQGKELEHYGVGDITGVTQAGGGRVITASTYDPQARVLWLAYSDGVGLFEPAQQKFYWSPALSVALGGLVPQVVATDGGRLWVGTDNGLMVFDKDQALQPWSTIEYECPADVRAAGVTLGEEPATKCGCWQRTFIDTERSADRGGSSLCVEFAMGTTEGADAKLSHMMKMDVTGSTGISFWAMSDRQREFYVDVTRISDLSGTVKKPNTETWRQVIVVHPRWQQYSIPYASMKLGGGQTPSINSDSIYITGIHLIRSVKDFGCPGDTGRLWVDKLGWMTNGNQRSRLSMR